MPLTTGYTIIDKNVLNTVRLFDYWSDSLTVAVNVIAGTTDLYPITITNWRFEETSLSITVQRAPGAGYPGDCNGWTLASTNILSRPMKQLDLDSNVGSTVVDGITYPEIQGAGTGTVYGEYTKILFPCDRTKYITDNTTDEIEVIQSSTSDEGGLVDWSESLPKEFDHLTSYRPDPTHDVILTYHIWVYYTGGILAGTPETGTPGDPEYDPGTPDVIIADGWEIHTVTQKVLNNTDQHRKILSWLLQKQRSVEDQQALYGFGTADPKYDPYAVVE